MTSRREAPDYTAEDMRGLWLSEKNFYLADSRRFAKSSLCTCPLLLNIDEYSLRAREGKRGASQADRCGKG